jgi:hypothetical protein
MVCDMTIKQEVIKSLANLPDNATAEEVEYHIYVTLLLHQRLTEDDGKRLTIDEVRRRLGVWRE